MYKIVNTQAEPITSQDGNDEWEDVQIEPGLSFHSLSNINLELTSSRQDKIHEF